MTKIKAPSKTNKRSKRRIPCIFWLLLFLIVLTLKIMKGENQSLTLFTSGSTMKTLQTQDDYPLPEGVVVGYAISITYCHPDDFIADAAGVLAHSIHLQSSRTMDANGVPKSRYDYRMYAFVHPDAQNCSYPLEKLGYEVLVRETPVKVEDIRNAELRHDVTTQGCCQEKEFLKLYSLSLASHKIVVHLDLDVIILRNMDALFDAMMLPDAINYEYNYNVSNTKVQEKHQPNPPILKRIPDAMWASTKTIPITSFFTRDYNMAKQMHETPPNRVAMQGGFWIVQPNLQVFDDFVQVILDGHKYTSDWGWGGRDLPKASYYGGAQIQGLVSYYYGFVRPGISVELNKCIYNNMVDRPRAACVEAGMSETQCQDCRRTPIEKVRSFHLTLCKKPWWCPTWIEEPLCGQFHYEWHRIRVDLEQQLGLRSAISVSSSTLHSLVNTSDMKQVLGAFPHHCSRMGSKGYKPIPFPFLADQSKASNIGVASSKGNNGERSEGGRDQRDQINTWGNAKSWASPLATEGANVDSTNEQQPLEMPSNNYNTDRISGHQQQQGMSTWKISQSGSQNIENKGISDWQQEEQQDTSNERISQPGPQNLENNHVHGWQQQGQLGMTNWRTPQIQHLETGSGPDWQQQGQQDTKNGRMPLHQSQSPENNNVHDWQQQGQKYMSSWRTPQIQHLGTNGIPDWQQRGQQDIKNGGMPPSQPQNFENNNVADWQQQGQQNMSSWRAPQIQHLEANDIPDWQQKGQTDMINVRMLPSQSQNFQNNNVADWQQQGQQGMSRWRIPPAQPPNKNNNVPDWQQQGQQTVWAEFSRKYDNKGWMAPEQQHGHGAGSGSEPGSINNDLSMPGPAQNRIASQNSAAWEIPRPQPQNIP